MSSFYEKNRETMTRRFPELERHVQQGFGDDSLQIACETGRSGVPTAKIRGRYLHSKLDPWREAERLIDRTLQAGCELCVVLGFGFAYHIEALLRRDGQVSILVIERRAAILRTAMQERDLSGLFDNPRIHILVEASEGEIRSALASHGRSRICLIDLEQFVREDPDYYRRAASLVEELRSRRSVNMATLKRFGRLWIRNLAWNLDRLAEAKDVARLENAAKGIPVLLLAAGPGLDEILPLIDEMRKRMVLVAVDTAAGALASVNQVADIVVVVDPQYWNTRHLDALFRTELPLQTGKTARGRKKSIFVSESSTHPRIFRLPHAGLYFGASLFPLGAYLEEVLGEKRKLGAGGSVATTAWDVCRLIGASEIFLAGLDLGFPGGQTHYKGGFFEERLHGLTDRLSPYSHSIYRYIMEGSPSRYPNYAGGTTLTDRRLAVYRRWFEEQLSMNDDPKTYNLNRFATRIEGIEHRPLDRLFALPERREEIDSAFAALSGRCEPERAKPSEDPSLEERREALRDRSLALIDELSGLYTIAGRGLHEIDKIRIPGDPVDLGLLDKVDQEILTSSGKGLAEFIIQPILEEILTSEEGEGILDDRERREIVFERSRRIYEQICISAEYHIRLFRRSLFQRKRKNG